MNKIKTVFLAVLSLLVCSAFVEAQTAGAPAKEKETIAVSKIAPTPALEKKLSRNPAEAESLGIVSESLSGLLAIALQKTNRFNVVTRDSQGLSAMQEEQAFVESGNVDRSDKYAARAGKMRGAKYAVTTTIYDFSDNSETKRFATLGKAKTRRDLRFNVTVKITDTTTGEIKATDRFESKSNTQAVSGINSDSDTDEYVTELAEDVADKIAIFVADTIVPPRVIGKTGKRVTINRGQGSGIAVGQVWEIYTPGVEMIDPDTGENLGAEEIPVGKISIIQVTPKFSVGNASEDFGIERNAIARRVKNKTKSASKK